MENDGEKEKEEENEPGRESLEDWQIKAYRIWQEASRVDQGALLNAMEPEERQEFLRFAARKAGYSGKIAEEDWPKLVEGVDEERMFTTDPGIASFNPELYEISQEELERRVARIPDSYFQELYGSLGGGITEENFWQYLPKELLQKGIDLIIPELSRVELANLSQVDRYYHQKAYPEAAKRAGRAIQDRHAMFADRMAARLPAPPAAGQPGSVRTWTNVSVRTSTGHVIARGAVLVEDRTLGNQQYYVYATKDARIEGGESYDIYLDDENGKLALSNAVCRAIVSGSREGNQIMFEVHNPADIHLQ